MKLLIMQFPPISRHFVSLRSKYSPQHPVLKLSEIAANISMYLQASHTLNSLSVTRSP
jgi:hypothetical protein